MISYPKKCLLILCLLLACRPTFGMASYAQQAWHEATATTNRTMATILAAAYLGYEVYRFMSLTIKRSLLKHEHGVSVPDVTKPYATLFVHGLKATGEQGNEYDHLLKINHAVHTFDFDDACIDINISALRQCGLAQEHDVKKLKENIEAHADKNLVLFGLSRGASTIITTMGIHKPKNIHGLILESPFDDMHSVVIHKASYAAWIPGVTALGDIATSFIFPNYSTCALRPIDLITYIPDEIPVLFICSQQDTLVPAWSTKRLYNKLKEHRENRKIRSNVYLMEAEIGKHGQILHNNRDQYQRVVHAFHKEAGLPVSAYYDDLATDGKLFLTQP